MKFTSFIAVSALLASAASAFTVITPSGWTSTGPNEISYTSVDTDSTSFAAVLKYSNGTSTVLVDDHTTSDGNFTISATCSSPYSTGEGFSLNFIKNLTSLNTILAQSQTFNIITGTTSCSSASASSASASASASSASASAASASASASSSSSSAFSQYGLPSASVVLGAIALVGASFV